jgi:ubiquinone/menaquinone biosynthesis C-methylase UbiE
MAQSDAVFAGALPRLYDDNLDTLLFTPYATDLARRLRKLTAGRVLETAAGTGILTRAIAAALPKSVEIVATDLNQPMLDHAMTKPDLRAVRFEQADAQALPFPDQSFDAVVCQFGIMFFPDRPAGMREALRVLKPGGRFLFNVWGPIAENPVMAAVEAALKRRHPAHPSWFLERTPCGYHDPDRIRTDLTEAGFAHVSVETVALTGQAADARAPAIGMCQGSPLSAEIESVEPGSLQAATEAAAAEIAARFGSGPITVPLLARVIEASRD